jgi:trehalose 6-phosphate synthase
VSSENSSRRPDPRQLGVPVVLLSHRAPVQFRREGDERRVRRGSGGLVTALIGLAGQLDDAVWVCAADSEEDSAVAREFKGRPIPVVMTGEPHVRETGETGDSSPVVDVRLVDIDCAAHDDFYAVIANPLLWFVQHGLYDLTRSPNIGRRERDAFEHGYLAVNEAFADAVAQEVEDRGGRALVMLHDYHFYLVADLVRRRCPDVVLSHFVHIPWPGPDAWRVLPPDMRERILVGLLGNDVVAFHTERFARNFLLCAQELLGLQIDLDAMTVTVGPRTVTAKTYPISIDVDDLRKTAAGDAVRERAAELETGLIAGGQLIVRVDRTDPSKNIVRGFLAFEQLLDDHPELLGKVRFLAFLQPSRLDVPEYADYVGRIGSVVARINAKHTRRGEAPIDLRLHEDFPTAVAAYTLCDVVMVNSIADGMNLVAKEAVSVSQRNAVLALSENTGAHEELGAFAVTLYPFDVQQQADALYEALTMPATLRRERREAAASIVAANDVTKWLDVQLGDLAQITGLWEPRRSAVKEELSRKNQP